MSTTTLYLGIWNRLQLTETYKWALNLLCRGKYYLRRRRFYACKVWHTQHTQKSTDERKKKRKSSKKIFLKMCKCLHRSFIFQLQSWKHTELVLHVRYKNHHWSVLGDNIKEGTDQQQTGNTDSSIQYYRWDSCISTISHINCPV